MPKRNLTRRRMIAIMATAAGSALVAGGRIARADEAVRWRGTALGAQVSLEIYHPDRTEAERLVQAVPRRSAAAGAAIQPLPARLGYLHA